ncbi:MAG: glycosyltransferase family 4 protein [Bacteroidales bacterium]|nr:glycosyltransferase family 4 protein [Bacteroidales bacterium]
MKQVKILRVATVPGSLDSFCKDLLRELVEHEGYEVVAVSSPGPELDVVARREGVRTVAVAMERRMSPLRDLKSLWRLIRVFRREKPAMVHSMTPKAGLLSMMAAWFCRVPVRIHTFTGLVFPTSTGLRRRILMMTDWLTCLCATHVIPEGKGVRDDLLNNRITRKPLEVLGHGSVKGINLTYFNPKLIDVQAEAAKIRKEGVFSYIFIGRLVGDKGINELVLAFKQLNKEYPATRLVLVGRKEQTLDPLKAETLAEISRNAAIEAVGEQSDVRPWLASSDVLVFPSYREGFPNVVIEAGAMGLPSIVTDINGSREIIINAENGYIVPSHNVTALYESMKTMLTNRDEVARMSGNARGLVASRYEQTFVRHCIKSFYAKAIRDSLGSTQRAGA